MHYENILMNPKHFHPIIFMSITSQNFIFYFIYIIGKDLADSFEWFSVAIAMYLYVAILFGLQTVEWRDIPPGVGALKYVCSVITANNCPVFPNVLFLQRQTYVDSFTMYFESFYGKNFVLIYHKKVIPEYL